MPGPGRQTHESQQTESCTSNAFDNLWNSRAQAPNHNNKQSSPDELGREHAVTDRVARPAAWPSTPRASVSRSRLVRALAARQQIADGVSFFAQFLQRRSDFLLGEGTMLDTRDDLV